MNNERFVDADEALRGLRALVLTSSGLRETKAYVNEPLKAAKARWDWHVDVVCKRPDLKGYQELAAPAGSLYAEPSSLEEVAPWESDQELAATIDAKIQEAERITGVPIGQIVLAADSRIGRAFVAAIIHVPETSDSLQIYETDNREPFRAIRRLFHWADGLLENSRPDFIFSYEWARPWLFVLWLAAQRRGIPCIAVRRSKIRSGSSFFTADPMMFNVAARSRAKELRQNSEANRAIGDEYLSTFRGQPRELEHIQAKWKIKSGEAWLAWHRNWASSMFSRTMRRIAGRETGKTSDFKELFNFNRREIHRYRHRHILKTFEDGELQSMRYVLYPMHKETDLPLNYQAAAWFDQRNTVRLLASVLPNGYQLLVREHRRNYGLRPESYYRELSILPNVTLVSAFNSQFKYIENADLIVTENGSSGWEGLIFGRRVLTLSQTFYDGAGRARKLDRHDTLARTVVEMLAAEAVTAVGAHDRDLACMVQAEYETTFAEDDMTTAMHQLSSVIAGLRTPSE